MVTVRPDQRSFSTKLAFNLTNTLDLADEFIYIRASNTGPILPTYSENTLEFRPLNPLFH